jgi:DNA-binding response OmpR family regulator
LLLRWGAAPATATNREEALAEMARLHAERGDWPALLLVDYHLDHDVTGLEIIEALRSESGSLIPAAIVTADHSDDVAAKVREAGHTLLHKPVKPAALRALVNRALSRRSAA